MKARRVSAREVTEAAIDADRGDRTRGSAPSPTGPSSARSREADAVDAAVAAGAALPLAGVPYAVKNLFDIEGVVTRAGSKINRDNPPAAADATLVRRMRAAGAVLLGAPQHGRVRLRLHRRERP